MHDYEEQVLFTVTSLIPPPIKVCIIENHRNYHDSAEYIKWNNDLLKFQTSDDLVSWSNVDWENLLDDNDDVDSARQLLHWLHKLIEDTDTEMP